jgi:hypothetical protein
MTCLQSPAKLSFLCLVTALSACSNTDGSSDRNAEVGGAVTGTTGAQEEEGGSSSDKPAKTGGASATGGKGSGVSTGGTAATGGKGSGVSTGTGGTAATGGKGSGVSTGGTAATGGSATLPSGGTATCKAPVFTSADKYGQYTFPDDYMVFNNIWSGSGGPQTIYACSPSNWYVVSNQPVISNSRGEIKSYPCSKWDFGGKPLNTFTTITSSYAATAPDEGVWNAAYDIWLGPGGWDIEVMLWTHYRYLATLPPGGAVATDSATIDGIEYYAWTYGSDYIGLAMKKQQPAGTLNFRHVFDWIVSKQWIPANAELHAFEYGIEIAETNGKELTFGVTDFSASGQ